MQKPNWPNGCSLRAFLIPGNAAGFTHVVQGSAVAALDIDVTGIARPDFFIFESPYLLRPTGTAVDFLLRINGAAASARTTRQISADAATATSSPSNVTLASTGYTLVDEVFFNAEIVNNLGLRKPVEAGGSTLQGGTSCRGSVYTKGWILTTGEITSIGVETPTPLGIGIGSQFNLWAGYK